MLPVTPSSAADPRTSSRSCAPTTRLSPTLTSPWRSRSPKGTWWLPGGSPAAPIRASSWASLHPEEGPSIRKKDRGERDEHGPHLGGQDRRKLEQLGGPGDDAPDRCHPGIRAYPRRIGPAMQGTQIPLLSEMCNLLQPSATIDRTLVAGAGISGSSSLVGSLYCP